MTKSEKHKIKDTERNILDDEIKHRERVFVLFYASLCPFSQKFLPIFEEYAKNNPQECIRVLIDDKQDLCEKYSIEYYPTVILFKKGKVQRRLDAKPGIGLNKEQLREFTKL